MADKYLTYWVIKSSDEKLIMRSYMPGQCYVDMVDANYSGTPLQLRARSDCQRLIDSMGECQEEFLFQEIVGPCRG